MHTVASGLRACCDDGYGILCPAELEEVAAPVAVVASMDSMDTQVMDTQMQEGVAMATEQACDKSAAELHEALADAGRLICTKVMACAGFVGFELLKLEHVHPQNHCPSEFG